MNIFIMHPISESIPVNAFLIVLITTGILLDSFISIPRSARIRRSTLTQPVLRTNGYWLIK